MIRGRFMKLPNFLENNIFEEVKSKMNIED